MKDEEPGLPANQLTHSTRVAAPGTRPAAAGRVSRRLRLGWPLMLLALAGCTDLSRSSVDAVKLALHRHTPLAPTAAEVAAKPYFQMQATGPDGSAVLILGNIDGARQDWYGDHGVALFLERGRIVQTTGLGQNLDGLQLPANDPFARGLQNLVAPVEYHYSVDWSPGYRYGVPVQATLTPAGTEQVSILGTSHQLLRVDEQLSAPLAGYHATNHYWVDPKDGFIWKSVQQVAPGISLQLVQLRPYRAAQR
jgi:hypothetical protein